MISLGRTGKRFINRVLERWGYALAPVHPHALDSLTFVEMLSRLRPALPAVGTIIDVGASDGRWSALARPFFPDAHDLLIEANRIHQPKLAAYSAAVPRTTVELVAAGDADGEVYFNAEDPFGGVASHEAGANMQRIPVRAIDSLLRQHRLPAPYFIKLDTHGFEVPILEGAREALADAQLLLIETYNFDIASGSLRFPQMCLYLEERGFRPAGLCDPLFRRDGALWQFDLLFMPSHAPIFADSTYQSP